MVVFIIDLLGLFFTETTNFLISDFVRVSNLKLVVIATGALWLLAQILLTSGQLVVAISLQRLRNELHGDELVGFARVGDALMVSALFEGELLLIVLLVILEEVVCNFSSGNI